MLLFLFIAFNLGLLALAAGVVLLIWSLRNNEVGSTLAKIAGVLISILALSGVIYMGSNLVSAFTEKPTPPPSPQSMQPEMAKPEMDKTGTQKPAKQ